jgi:purine-binding chemotaxis protein CheW
MMNIADRNIERESFKNEYLSFQLGKEEFCLEILKVQEIRGYEDITTIANTPEYIKGVLNLRGEVVPIIDLRIRLNLKDIEYNDFTVVIILNLEGSNLGIVVDGVSDVIALNVDEVQELPGLISNINTKFITGVVNIDMHTLLLIDIENLLSRDELGATMSQSLQ